MFNEQKKAVREELEPARNHMAAYPGAEDDHGGYQTRRSTWNTPEIWTRKLLLIELRVASGKRLLSTMQSSQNPVQIPRRLKQQTKHKREQLRQIRRTLRMQRRKK